MESWEKSLEGITMDGSKTPIKFYVKTYPKEERELLTEAILECLRRKYPLNRMEIGIVAR